MRGVSIDYDVVRSKFKTAEYDALAARLHRSLPPMWQKAYRKMAQAETNVLRFSDHGYEFLFDHASELVARGILADDRAVEDRIIVAFGRTNGIGARRDVQRANGFLGSAAAILGGRTNRDHVPGCVLGGAFDVSLFPQRRDLRRDWTADGRAYRAMERYCVEHPGTFAFSRPVYDSKSWWPCEIEYGLLRSDGTFWIQLFDNGASPLLRVPFLTSGRAAATAR
jgi:hypothetical protein